MFLQADEVILGKVPNSLGGGGAEVLALGIAEVHKCPTPLLVPSIPSRSIKVTPPLS